jgi:hypothetical protein
MTADRDGAASTGAVARRPRSDLENYGADAARLLLTGEQYGRRDKYRPDVCTARDPRV